jgi:hypothetical protein
MAVDSNCAYCIIYQVPYLNIVTYPGIAWLLRRVLDFRIDFLDLYTTGYNSSQITAWHTVIFFWLDTSL